MYMADETRKMIVTLYKPAVDKMDGSSVQHGRPTILSYNMSNECVLLWRENVSVSYTCIMAFVSRIAAERVRGRMTKGMFENGGNRRWKPFGRSICKHTFSSLQDGRAGGGGQIKKKKPSTRKRVCMSLSCGGYKGGFPRDGFQPAVIRKTHIPSEFPGTHYDRLVTTWKYILLSLIIYSIGSI